MMKEMQRQLTVLLLLTVGLRPALSNGPEPYFTSTYIRMCLKPEFLHSPNVAPDSEIICAATCLERGSRCQGFWLPEGRCQTFEFDKCSHMVNVANCSHFALAFVRKQENLPEGHLCPEGYGYQYNSSTYKMVDISSWTDGLTKCSSEPGLTKYADAMDRPESDHMNWLKTVAPGASSYYVGGHRIADFSGSDWIWDSCNAIILPELWMPGQPVYSKNYNRASIWSAYEYGLDDLKETWGSVKKALCECVNPFV